MKDKAPTRKIAIVIGVLLAILSISLILRNGVFSRASDQQPQDVTVRAESTSTEVIQWTTGSATQGQVVYSTDIKGPWDTAAIVPEEASSTDHKVTLTRLTEGKPYYFRIQIGDKMYDNVDGQPWNFITVSTTGATSTTTVSPATSPSPIQRLHIPSDGSATSVPTVEPTTAVPAVCLYTTCEEIPAKFDNGCSTQDYLTCLHKPTPTP